MSLPGVYQTTLNDGTVSYRSSMTYRNKHISLGSYSDERTAYEAYVLAHTIFTDDSIQILDYKPDSPLAFEKWVTLINYRDNRIYFVNPIYLMKSYFVYYLGPDIELKFDLDDLFYYSSHKIMQKGGHLFVADYGMQVTLPSRYGIKNYAVTDKDYYFINGDPYDFRYHNIRVLNAFHGVTMMKKGSETKFRARIHLRSYYIIGYYDSPVEAAVAYNKAVDIVKRKLPKKRYSTNYILELTSAQYAELYNKVKISERIYTLG